MIIRNNSYDQNESNIYFYFKIIYFTYILFERLTVDNGLWEQIKLLSCSLQHEWYLVPM